jgi:hypothetical protein
LPIENTETDTETDTETETETETDTEPPTETECFCIKQNPPPPPPPPIQQGDVHFVWRSASSAARGSTDPDAFADDNITTYGDHWAIDWIQLGEKQGQLLNGIYKINNQDTSLNSSGSGEWNGQFYLFGRRLAASFGRREISNQWPNTLINASSLTIGSPVMSSSWTGRDFGTVNTSFSVSNGLNFLYFGGIMYKFLNSYARSAATSGTQVFGPIGQNATFASEPQFRITGLSSSPTPTQIVIALAGSITEASILGVMSDQCSLCDLFTDLASTPPPTPTPTPDPDGNTPTIVRNNVVSQLERANPNNCDCDGNRTNSIIYGGYNSDKIIPQNNTVNSVCKIGCCCSAPESYFWEDVGICVEVNGQSKAKCENITCVRNGSVDYNTPFFYFNSASNGPAVTDKQTVVANGKVTELNLIKHLDEKDGFGVRAFITNNSAGKQVGFYTGGFTFS